MVGRHQVDQLLPHHQPGQPLRVGIRRSVVSRETPRVHLKDRSQLPPAVHLRHRVRAGQIAVSLGMRDHDPSPRRRGFAQHTLVRPLQIEPELHQHPAAAGEPHLRAARDPAEQRRVGRPDLLAQSHGRQIRRTLQLLEQAVEGRPLALELAVDRGVAGQVRQEQVRCSDHRADAFPPEPGQRLAALLGGAGAVVHGGNQMAVQVGEGG